MTVKELKSVDISSYTIISTGISVLLSVIVAVILVAGMAVAIPDSFSVMAYLIPTIIFATLICSIFLSFSEGYLYNFLSKKLKAVTLDIDDNGLIKSISTTPTALLVAIITTVILIVVYLALSFILPILLSSVIQTLMFTGQSAVAYSLYQGLVIISDASVIAMGIVATFIITFIFTLLGTYIYNIIGSKRGVNVKLTDGVLDSINPVSLGIAVAIISLILNIIIGLIMIISGGNWMNAVSTIVSGFVGGFIDAVLIALFYNFLAPKLGKLKIELIDC